MHSKELIEIVKQKRASGASYGIIGQEMGLKRASVQSIVNNNKKKKRQGRPPIIKTRKSMQIKRCLKTLIDTKKGYEY